MNETFFLSQRREGCVIVYEIVLSILSLTFRYSQNYEQVTKMEGNGTE